MLQYDMNGRERMVSMDLELKKDCFDAFDAGAEQILTGGDTPGGKQDSRATWKREKKLKFSYKEEREYATIESDIEVLEKKLEELDTKMLEVASDFGKLNALTKEKEEVEAQLLEKMERWEYLEDLAEKIANQ